jgi:hypothetical protein
MPLHISAEYLKKSILELSSYDQIQVATVIAFHIGNIEMLFETLIT